MIYADYAATNGVVPPEVAQAVAEYLRAPGNPGRGQHPAAMRAARLVLEARFALAEFFDFDFPERVVFTGGATESLNLSLRGLLRPGDHVVTTELEHNSVLRPLYALEKEGVSLSISDGSPEGIEAAMRPETRAVVMTHASNVTGEVLDIRAAAKIAHRRGALLIVDAAQTAGVMPVSMREDGMDVLCFAGHKALLGMQGVGGLLVASGVNLRPLKTGGSGMRSLDREMPEGLPEALEAGTLNIPGIASLMAGVRVCAGRGLEHIARHERELAELLCAALAEIPGVTVYENPKRPRVGVVSMNIDGMDAAQAADRLARDYGIATRAGAHCAPLVHKKYGTRSMVRFSFGWESTKSDALACARAVYEIAESGGTR